MNAFLTTFSKLQHSQQYGINPAAVGLFFESFGVQNQIAVIRELSNITISFISKNISDPVQKKECDLLYALCVSRLAEVFQKTNHPDIRRTLTRNAIDIFKAAKEYNIKLQNDEQALLCLLEAIRDKDDLQAFEWLHAMDAQKTVADLWVYFRFSQKKHMRISALNVLCDYPDDFILCVRTSFNQSYDEFFVTISNDEYSHMVDRFMEKTELMVAVDNITWLFGLCEKAYSDKNSAKPSLKLMGKLVQRHRFLISRILPYLEPSVYNNKGFRFNSLQVEIIGSSLKDYCFEFPEMMFFQILDSYMFCSGEEEKFLHMRILCDLWDDPIYALKLEQNLATFLTNEENAAKKTMLLQFLCHSDIQPFRCKLLLKFVDFQSKVGEILKEDPVHNSLNYFLESFMKEYPDGCKYSDISMKVLQDILELQPDLCFQCFNIFTPLFLSVNGDKYDLVCKFFQHYSSMSEIPDWFSEHVIERYLNKFVVFLTSEECREQTSMTHIVSIAKVLLRCQVCYFTIDDYFEAMFPAISYTDCADYDDLCSLIKLCCEGGLPAMVAHYLDPLYTFLDIDYHVIEVLKRWFVTDHFILEPFQWLSLNMFSGEDLEYDDAFVRIDNNFAAIKKCFDDLHGPVNNLLLIRLLKAKVAIYENLRDYEKFLRRIETLPESNDYSFVLDRLNVTVRLKAF